MYYNQKQKDLNKEEKINQFLVDEFFRENLKSTEPIKDLQQQFKGIDIICEDNIKVDLKSALTRMDGSLNTFCLELCFKNVKGKYQKGWFLNNQLETDYYSFNYFINKNGSYYTDNDNILFSELIIVNRKYLKDFVRQYYTKEIIEVIKDLIFTETQKYKINDDLTINQSLNLNEKPVNLLINKNRLIELSDIHVIIEHKNKNTFFFKDNRSSE